MAKSKNATKNKNEASTVAATSVALIGLAAIVAATVNGGFAWVGLEEAKNLAAEGLTESNNDVSDGRPEGTIATRATQKGIDMNAQTQTIGKGDVATVSAAQVLGKSEFVIETGVALPKSAARGRTGSKYPFEALQLSQSFFIPEKKVSDLASTIAGANARYASEKKDDKGAVVIRTNRKNKVVPELVYSRKFVVRNAEKDGVKGARVFRTV